MLFLISILFSLEKKKKEKRRKCYAKNKFFYNIQIPRSRNWLFQQVLLPHGCNIIEVKYLLKNCSACFLELISHSIENINIANYPSVDSNVSNIDLIDHRINLFQKEICSQHSYLFVGIRGDVNSATLESVKIYTIKCPEV